MPQLTLPESLRYFFSPFIFLFYYLIYHHEKAKTLVSELGVLGSASFLVAVARSERQASTFYIKRHSGHYRSLVARHIICNTKYWLCSALYSFS